MKKQPPRDLPGKIEFAGREWFGPWWRAKTAAGLGVSRSQFHTWLTGHIKSDRDIESDLIDLIARE
jgi:hypothetical protein